MQENSVIRTFGWNKMLTEYLMEREITLDEAILRGGYLIDCNTRVTYYTSDYLGEYVYPNAKYLEMKLYDFKQSKQKSASTPHYSKLKDLLDDCACRRTIDIRYHLKSVYNDPLADEIMSFLYEKYMFYKLDSLNELNVPQKYYFQDTGVLCRLLEIKDVEQLRKHHQYDSIFKNFIINEVIKLLRKYNKSLPIGYLNDGQGYEVDLVIPKDDHNLLIKTTRSSDFYYEMTDNLRHFGDENDERIIVYQGTKVEEYKGIKAMPVRDFLNYCYESFS